MLQFVLGRAGYGKTEYVFRKIKNLVEQGENNILLITPEQFSFVSEQRLLTDLGEDKMNCVTNLSFSQLTREIYKLYGKPSLPILSKGSKAVIFKVACSLCRDELTVFQKNVDNIAFINSAIDIYDEMKTCRVSSADIQRAIENVNKPVLAQKLHDVSLIIDTYDNIIKDKYLDSACEMTDLYQRIRNLDYFRDKIVFIDGFAGFAAQEYKIIEVILKQAKSTTITLCTDSFNNNDKYDLFYYVNSGISILKDVASKLGVAVSQPIILSEQKRFNNDELKYIEKYSFSDKKCTLEPQNNISIYRAKGITDECNYVSRKISRLLRSGIRADRIAVICRDMDKYQNEMQFSFHKYNIPFFNDERQSISCQPLVRFVSFLLRVLQYSYRSDDVFSLLKLGLTELSNEQVSSLENYAFVWSINGLKWKNEFVNSPRGLGYEINNYDRDNLMMLNEARDYFVSRIEKLKKRCKNANAREISEAVYYCLIDFGVDKGIRELATSLSKNGKSALASEQGRIWDMLMEILNSLATVSSDSPISVKEYTNLFRLMVSNEDLGSLPSGIDNIQFGSADRIRCNKPYAVFLVGANEGEFPNTVLSSGLLSDADRTFLLNNDFKLYSCGEILNSQERYYAYMALCAPSDRLYVSYRASAEDGAESEIVVSLKSIFNESIVEKPCDDLSYEMLESDDNAFEILSSYYENNDNTLVATLKEYFKGKNEYKNRLNAVDMLVTNDEISIENSTVCQGLFGKNMYLSASRIEDYYNCAFRYFCKFGLGAKKIAKAELDSMQTGTAIHYVLENIIKEYGSDGLVQLTDSQISVAVGSYLNRYLEEKLGACELINSRFKYQLLRLSKMLKYVVQRLRDEFSVSDFKAAAFEINIGNGSNEGEIKSKKIDLANGSIQIKGAIDRVDIYNDGNEQYVRVVDYKSGIKDFNLNDILYGLNLQMFIYLFTLCESDNELKGTAAGVLYMHSAREIYNAKRSVCDEDIKKEDKLCFRMKGVVLNDEKHEIARHMEKDLNEQFIPVKQKKDGSLTGNVVSLEDLGRISRKINQLVFEMGSSLHNGKIMRNPINGKNHDKTCEFCDYSDVCMNFKEITQREMDEFSFDDVLNLLKEDEDAELD